ncbi:MAG TPA: hypothetical protein VNA20_08655 [Frankiaceae bacterium]|nr:hypothetical protein [Frankiaceae bacterium]
MSRLAYSIGAGCVAVALSTASIPAGAAPRSHLYDCLTWIGGTTWVDTALCIVLESLPPEVAEPLRPVVAEPAAQCAAGHWEACDQFVCPVLAGHAGGYGSVEIRADGDVYVAGERVWDCPPYEPWGE